MKKQIAIILAAATFAACGGRAERPSYTSYVDPLVGTAATGHTYPGAVLPFGMVSASPDTHTEGWANSSGYHADDSNIMGFSQTHMSGTGAADMGDVMLMPVTGDPLFDPGPREDPDRGYRSRFRHETEKARPGYYGVTLDDYDVEAEMTVTARCAFYRFAYPEGRRAGILFDLEHGIGDHTRACNIRLVDDRTLEGYRRSGGFVNDHVYYFRATFSEPVKGYQGYWDWNVLPAGEQADDMSKMYLEFEPGRQVLMKLALSTVSEEGAAANLAAEIPHWDFDRTACEADRVWNSYLSKIEIDADEDTKTIFYTAMYHSLIVPNLITDTDGRYRGWDGQVHDGEGDLYTNYSLWDTYRAVHPLYNILLPERNLSFIRSMIEKYRQTGQLPINEYGTCETYCMIGYHAVPVIAEAILNGMEGFDYGEAYAAMRSIATDPARGVGLMERYGYIPGELENNSVSKVLEYAYDDWCLAQVARKLDKAEDYDYFIRRAANYRNHFDPATGFMRGRKADGHWTEPFDPRAVSVLGHGDFTEGNSWQYTFYVPHDMTALVGMMGGDEAFAARLDTLFTTAPGVDNEHAVDVTGLIGQYAHGNEPSHHTAYLYNFAGRPWKTQQIVSRIKGELYGTGRDGLCGNDDCGQMSCWYIYSALGFYPVTPGMGYCVIGSPSVRYARLELPGGRVFEVKAPEASVENIYIRSVKLNGREYSHSYIEIADIMAGGVLEFEMVAEPDLQWGTAPADRPVARIGD